jgi:hypothetical protein
MSLDLDDILNGWTCPLGEVAARLVEIPGEAAQVQLRVDLGVLQMHLDGRPDGDRYHGLPTVLDYLKHELRVGRDNISYEHWLALEREVTQINYRRVACASLAEEALRSDDDGDALGYMGRVILDIDRCRSALLLERRHLGQFGRHGHLLPTLVFNRARLLSQMRVLERDYDAAIDAAEDGVEALRQLLEEFGFDEDSENVGIIYLTELSRHLRVQHSVQLTLRERLNVAIENEDYELAAQVHAEMRRRHAPQGAARPLLPPPA